MNKYFSESKFVNRMSLNELISQGYVDVKVTVLSTLRGLFTQRVRVERNWQLEFIDQNNKIVQRTMIHENYPICLSLGLDGRT